MYSEPIPVSLSLLSFALGLSTALAATSWGQTREVEENLVWNRDANGQILSCTVTQNGETLQYTPRDCLYFVTYEPRKIGETGCYAYLPSKEVFITEVPYEWCLPDWKPYKADSPLGPDVTYTRKKCTRKGPNGAIIMSPFDEKGNVIQDCAPEVIYSWRRSYHLEKMQQDQLQYGYPDFSQRTLWGWRTPIGTFAYGNYLFRGKLKPGTQFHRFTTWQQDGGCGLIPEDKRKNTIAVLDSENGMLVEYNVCDGRVFESWSFDTPEAFVEMQREREWWESHPTTEKDVYCKLNNSPYSYFGFDLDYVEWRYSRLDRLFSSVAGRLTERPYGKLYQIYNDPDVRPSNLEEHEIKDPDQRRKHFEVRYPDYFNHIVAETAKGLGDTDSPPRSE